MSITKRVLIALVLAWGAHSWWTELAVKHGPGVIAPEEPLQTPLDPTEPASAPFDFKGYRVTPLARIDLEARVLARENYYLGREADLVPIDFMFGWRRMSDESVLEKLDIDQSNRFGFWSASSLPIPRREIETSAGNMHLIAANSAIARRLAGARRGEVLHLNGLLVRVDAPGGWHWVSSLTREDTGAGACELIFVEQVNAIDVDRRR